MSDILQFFPLDTPRPKQLALCQYIERKVADGFTDIIIAAPTGIGKSSVGIAAAFWAASHQPPSGVRRGAYYGVTQKLLQDQLVADIPRFKPACMDCASIKSAESYECPDYGDCGAGARMSAAPAGQEGQTKRKKCTCLTGGSCPYRVAKARWLNATVSVTNYSYLFSAAMYTRDIARRQLFVIDEAHTLEEQIIRFVDGAASLSQAKRWLDLDRLPNLATLGDYTSWLTNEYVPALLDKLDELKRMELLADAQDTKIAKDVFDLDTYVCKLNRAIDQLDVDRENWVFWKEESQDKQDMQYVVRPVFGQPFMEQMVKSLAPVRLYMSAYPGVPSVVYRNLGLDPKVTAWANVGSDFPVENRRIHYYPMGSMSLASREVSTPRLLRAVSKIVAKHLDRGVIHCNSYELGKQIYDALCQGGFASRVIFPTNADAREQAVKNHRKNEGAILISPSMTEGFDFNGDAARWQIIAKCVDDETRIFTKRGLVLLKDAVIGDVTWAIDRTGSTVESRVLAKIDKPYNGVLYVYTSQGLSMAVTPDHRLFGKYLGQSQFSYILANDWRSKNLRIPRSFFGINFAQDELIDLLDWCRDDDVLVLRQSLVRHPTRKIRQLRGVPASKKWWLTKVFAEAARKLGTVLFQGRSRFCESPLVFSKKDLFEFLGWYMSEGRVDQTNSLGPIFLTQIKSAGKQKIQSLLLRLGVHFTYNGKDFVIRSGILRRFLDAEVTHYSHTKSVSRWVLAQNATFLRALLDGEVAGDGSISAHDGGPAGCATVSKKWADQIMEIGLKVGYTPVRSFNSFSGTAGCYGISFHRSNFSSPGKARFELKPYSGRVYCVTTEHGNFLAEREGKPFFTGNCPYPWLGDKQVVRKLELDPDWYTMRTVMTLIQACGRICRSNVDTGITYVLDSDFEPLWRKAQSMIPRWFQDAVVFHSSSS